MSEFYAEAPQATTSEGLAQGPYVEASAGFEPAILRMKGDNLPMSHHAQYTLYLLEYESLENVHPFIPVLKCVCLQNIFFYFRLHGIMSNETLLIGLLAFGELDITQNSVAE